VNPVLLSTAYCGPVSYFKSIAGAESVYLEACENYLKQSYRNRCVVLSANGPLPLIIPTVHNRDEKCSIRDIRIAYHTDWQRNHWRALLAAYRNSPYFCFYSDDISRYYGNRWDFLFDYNLEYLSTILSLLNLHIEIKLTRRFEDIPDTALNLRETFTPKPARQGKPLGIRFRPYTQVFGEKFPFIPDLSILDLLFNEGPAASGYLSWHDSGMP
jgi:hypothetical protein